MHRSIPTVALSLAVLLSVAVLPGQPPTVDAGGPPPADSPRVDLWPVPPPIPDGPITLASGQVLPVLPAALEHPGVQAEMLAQHDAEPLNFPPGLAPTVPLGFTQTLPAPVTSVPLDSPHGQPVGQGASASLRSPGALEPQAFGALPNGLHKEVFGFLPYWMLDDAELQWLRYDLVSTIGYFGVAAETDGTLAIGSTGWNGWVSSAMTGVINTAHARGVRVVLTVTMMAWDGGAGQAALLGDAAARARLVDAIVAAVRDRNADGVNLDFEPVYTPQRDQYTSFVRQLKAGLTAAGVGSYLTVCTTAGAATWATGYDLAALVAPGAADGIFVMGYDYSWSGSSRAGGVAPMDSPYMLDVNESVNDYLEIIPGAKIIWGVPYYGRTWRTTSDALNASTVSGASGASVAYYYVGNQVLQARHGRRWDLVGQVPWFAYWDTAAGTWVEGYYDDTQSLAIKWDMVNQRGLAGTGMWTLLMDQGSSDLWNLLASKFLTDTSPPTGGIVSLPAITDASAISVSWRAIDVGSGVSTYSVQVRDRAGGSWTPWQTDVSWTSAHYIGTQGHTYEFRLSTMDQRGNRQPWTSEAVEAAGEIGIGGFAWVNVDLLNVRSGAGTGFAVLDQLAAGDRVAVLGGPVDANGYQWYRVQFAFAEWPSAEYPRYGWVATGPPADPYLIPATAPTVSTLQPAVGGYAATPRRFSPDGDGIADGVTVQYTLAAAASGIQLEVLNGSGALVNSLALGPQAAGSHTAVWDGRLAGGGWAPGGGYLLRLVATDGAGTHVAPVAEIDPGAFYSWGVIAAVGPPGATYVPLAPSRLLDSRIGNGLAGPFSSGAPRTFQVSGRGGVPATAIAVTGNLTVTNQTAAGYVYLGPTGATTPTSSTLNFPVGDNRANGVTLALSPGGSLSATYIAAAGGRTDLVFDVTGYFVP